jgi:hypothetical protein
MDVIHKLFSPNHDSSIRELVVQELANGTLIQAVPDQEKEKLIDTIVAVIGKSWGWSVWPSLTGTEKILHRWYYSFPWYVHVFLIAFYLYGSACWVYWAKNQRREERRQKQQAHFWAAQRGRLREQRELLQEKHDLLQQKAALFEAQTRKFDRTRKTPFYKSYEKTTTSFPVIPLLVREKVSGTLPSSRVTRSSKQRDTGSTIEPGPRGKVEVQTRAKPNVQVEDDNGTDVEIGVELGVRGKPNVQVEDDSATYVEIGVEPDYKIGNPLTHIVRTPFDANSPTHTKSFLKDVIRRPREVIAAPWRNWTRYEDCSRLHTNAPHDGLDCHYSYVASKINYKHMLWIPRS